MQTQAAYSALCQCANCPGAGCTCGCQSAAQAVVDPREPRTCACGPRCGCDAAEQGCLCD